MGMGHELLVSLSLGHQNTRCKDMSGVMTSSPKADPQWAQRRPTFFHGGSVERRPQQEGRDVLRGNAEEVRIHSGLHSSLVEALPGDGRSRRCPEVRSAQGSDPSAEEGGGEKSQAQGHIFIAERRQEDED